MKRCAPAFPATASHSQPLSKNTEKIMELGYIAGKHVNLYGEHFERNVSKRGKGLNMEWPDL
jgi:hypothetical protein